MIPHPIKENVLHPRDFRRWAARKRFALAGNRKPGGNQVGHIDVKTAMIYKHVLNKDPLGVVSPADMPLWLRHGPSYSLFTFIEPEFCTTC